MKAPRATTTIARYGRAPRGERIDAAVPHGHGDAVTLSAAVRFIEVGWLIRSGGADVRYLPAHGPDFNPNKGRFRWLKEALRSAAEWAVDAILGATDDASRSVTIGDIVGWFRHCGCRYKQESTSLATGEVSDALRQAPRVRIDGTSESFSPLFKQTNPAITTK